MTWKGVHMSLRDYQMVNLAFAAVCNFLGQCPWEPPVKNTERKTCHTDDYASI